MNQYTVVNEAGSVRAQKCELVVERVQCWKLDMEVGFKQLAFEFSLPTMSLKLVTY